MEMRNNYKKNKVNFNYREPTCRDKLKLFSDKEILGMEWLPYEKIIDMLDVNMTIENDEKQYNLDTLPRKYFKELQSFANYIVIETLKDYTEQEEEAKKSE